MDKKQSLNLRKKIKHYLNKWLNVTNICKKLHINREFVYYWKDKDIDKDNRWWKKWKKRKYSDKQEESIIEARTELDKEDFFGNIAIQNKINDPNISIDFINRTLRKHNLVKSYHKKTKWWSRYMLYPIDLINNLWKILLQIDFIGPRYLTWSSIPYHFLSCKYVKPFKLHVFIPIVSQTTNEVLKWLYIMYLSNKHPIPDVLQMDNDSAFKWYINRNLCIWRLTRWCLINWVIPLFNAVNQPRNNWSVEWWNSVFDRKYWKQNVFESKEDMLIKLEQFNQNYEAYLTKNIIIDYPTTNVTNPTKMRKITKGKIIQPYVYILRVVNEHNDTCSIELFNECIKLPCRYKWQYVIAQVDVILWLVKIYQEINNEKVLIHECRLSISI